MDSTLWHRSRTQNAARALLAVALASFLSACSYSSTAAALSGPAKMGIPQDIELWDCGETPSGPTFADFDESLWFPVETDPYDFVSPTVDGVGPADTGTMTLVAPDRAEYRTHGGQVFTFERAGYEFTFEGCVPMAIPADEGG